MYLNIQHYCFVLCCVSGFVVFDLAFSDCLLYFWCFFGVFLFVLLSFFPVVFSDSLLFYVVFLVLLHFLIICCVFGGLLLLYCCISLYMYLIFFSGGVSAFLLLHVLIYLLCFFWLYIFVCFAFDCCVCRIVRGCFLIISRVSEFVLVFWGLLFFVW